MSLAWLDRVKAQGDLPLVWAAVRGIAGPRLSAASLAHIRLDCPGGQDASPGTSRGHLGPLVWQRN